MGFFSIFKRDVPKAEEPLIFTTNGNVPERTLKYHYAWEENDSFIKFREWYTDSRGHIVKDSSHLRGKVGGGLATALPGEVR